MKSLENWEREEHNIVHRRGTTTMVWKYNKSRWHEIDNKNCAIGQKRKKTTQKIIAQMVNEAKERRGLKEGK